jgi:maltodextrin utilization protein YvdJ
LLKQISIHQKNRGAAPLSENLLVLQNVGMNIEYMQRILIFLFLRKLQAVELLVVFENESTYSI